MKYSKLVRDKIPEYIRSKGEVAVFHVADEHEYWEKLKAKLLEEFAEFVNDESPEEFADLLEVLDAISDYKCFQKEKIEGIRKQKAEARGGFSERIILDEA